MNSGVAVASTNPGEMLKFIVIAVGSGLIGAFLSMLYVQVINIVQKFFDLLCCLSYSIMSLYYNSILPCIHKDLHMVT